MSITSAEIQYRLSGGASNSTPITSLGGVKSSTAAGSTLFDDVTGAQAAAGLVEFRCVYIHNADATLTLTAPVAWVNSDTPSASTLIEIGLGTSLVNATEQTVANETTPPTSVTFAPCANKAAGVALGDIPSGQSRALWIRRTVTAGAASTSSDPFTLRVEGETV